MEFREIETFLVLAEELHFGRTARRMHITQGRVSQMIRALEREVGGELFERTSRQVRLSELGERFHSGVRLGYDTLTRTLRDSRAVARGVRGHLRLGYMASVGAAFAARVATVVEEHRPDCAVTVVALRRLRLNLALEDDDADVILAWSPGGDGVALNTQHLAVGPVLATVPRGLLVPANHPLAACPEVGLEDLVDYEFLWAPDEHGTPKMRDLWVPRITPSGRPLRRTANDVLTMTGQSEIVADDLITLVARGCGLHFTVVSLLDHVPFPDLRIVPISDMPPMAIVPVWSSTAENPLIRSFADALAGFRWQNAATAATPCHR